MKIKELAKILCFTTVLSLFFSVFGTYAFAETSGDFNYIIENNTVTVTKYTGNGGVVSIPSKIGGKIVATLGNSAFASCKKITSITIPSGVKTIGNNVFYDCDGLTSVTIPNSVQTIGKYAFDNCSNLASVTIGTGTTTIDDKAFYNCYGLVSITIPNNVKTLGYSVFESCDNLANVTLGSGLTSIGEFAFYNCDSLMNITIPAGVASIGVGSFAACEVFQSVSVASGNASYTATSGVLYNKNKTAIICYPANKNGTAFSIPSGVTSISDYAFYDCNKLTAVTIPNSVQSIGYEAFWGCDSLKTLSIGTAVKTIGDSAFEWCSSITNVVIPNSVKTIGNNAFSFCDNISTITVGSGVTSIGYDAFWDCDALKNVSIPTSVKTIGRGAFAACNSLQNISVASGNTAFTAVSGVLYNYNKTELICYPLNKSGTSLVIPAGVVTISDYAFYYCNNLQSITFPNGITTIGNESFNGCDALTSVVLPNSIRTIGNSAFWGCDNLETLTIGNNIRSIGTSAFAYCKQIKNITIGAELRNVKNYAFYDCKLLQNVNFMGNPIQRSRIRIDAHNECFTNVIWSCKGEVSDPAKEFKDIGKKTWYYSAVNYAVNTGFFAGSNGKFDPNGNMTRGMFVSVLARMAGVTVNNASTTKFTDVKKGQWYTGAVKWASDHGIVTGSKGKFMPNDPITREQICTILVTYAKYMDTTLTSNTYSTYFKDDRKISSWAYSAVMKCQRAGLVSGSDGYFNPQGKASRAAVAQILMNYDKNFG